MKVFIADLWAVCSVDLRGRWNILSWNATKTEVRERYGVGIPQFPLLWAETMKGLVPWGAIADSWRDSANHPEHCLLCGYFWIGCLGSTALSKQRQSCVLWHNPSVPSTSTDKVAEVSFLWTKYWSPGGYLPKSVINWNVALKLCT